MQNKTIKRTLCVAVLAIIFLVGCMITSVLFTSLPVKILAFMLAKQDDVMKGAKLTYHSFFHRSLFIENLIIDDAIRNIHISDLEVEWNGQSIRKIVAKSLYFRDKTKPNQSHLNILKILLKENEQNHLGTSTKPICLGQIFIKQLKIGLSYSDEGFEINNINGKNLCFNKDVLEFENMEFDSWLLALDDDGLILTLGPSNFYDLKTDIQIKFRREQNKILLTRSHIIH